MPYVILRDDDTNALTPPHCLERLYRPFLERGLPVNLSVIPEVRANLTQPDGQPEGFVNFNGMALGSPSRSRCIENSASETIPIAKNQELVAYLQNNSGYEILQHGCHHDYFEFARRDRPQIVNRIEQGTRRLLEAGFPKPLTFVAPHDKFSDISLLEVSRHFPVVST